MQKCRIYMPFGTIWHISCTYFSMNKFLTKWRVMMGGPTNNDIFFYISGTLEHEFDIQDNWKTQIVFFFSPLREVPKTKSHQERTPCEKSHRKKTQVTKGWTPIILPMMTQWWLNIQWIFQAESVPVIITPRPRQSMASNFSGEICAAGSRECRDPNVGVEVGYSPAKCVQYKVELVVLCGFIRLQKCGCGQ